MQKVFLRNFRLILQRILCFQGIVVKEKLNLNMHKRDGIENCIRYFVRFQQMSTFLADMSAKEGGGQNLVFKILVEGDKFLEFYGKNNYICIQGYSLKSTETLKKAVRYKMLGCCVGFPKYLPIKWYFSV